MRWGEQVRTLETADASAGEQPSLPIQPSPPTTDLQPTADMVTPLTVTQGISLYLPLILGGGGTPRAEWTQHAHDAQRTAYTDQVVPPPWRWKWAWNGPDATGGIRADKFRLPRNSQPVTGGGRVYIAAGDRGVYALRESDGSVVWNRNPGGNINSTPAFDYDTGALFVVSSNGTLYRLDAASGDTLAQFPTDASSTLPLPPAVVSDRVFFSMGNRVYAVNKQTMTQIWAYDAGSPVHTPPAYSPSRDLVIAVSSDLYVHAIRNGNGTRAWRVKPTVRTGGPPDQNIPNQAEVSYGWPVVAEGHGYVLVKLRLDWNAIWADYLPSNEAIRQYLQDNPAYQALFVLDLDDGSVPFIANIGHGGFGDHDYLPMGPQPVVKRFPDGQEVVYTVIRGGATDDSRWDSHPGEMVLDGTTVPGLQPGYVRWIDEMGFSNGYMFFPTDEQPYVSMAGDYLFYAHWEAGAAYRIVDRSSARGSYSNPIATEFAPAIATSQDDPSCPFSPSHYCSDGLTNTRDYPPGFYIYYGQGAVYDQYWSEYAAWVVSNGTVYFLSTDGALVALEAGNPAAFALPGDGPVHTSVQSDAPKRVLPTARRAAETPAVPANVPVIPYTTARQHAGEYQTVVGTIRYAFNNGKAVCLGFRNPHRGAFKVRILREDWRAFPAPPEALYAVGQRVQVTGRITWYQGDPVIYVTRPEQIQIIGHTGTQDEDESVAYLPLVMRRFGSEEILPRINIPRFSDAIPFEQTAIAWFGQVSPAQNYTDIRVGYNANELYVYLAIFDRALWYDENPTPQTLTQWDAATLFLDTSGGTALSPSSWRFVAQLYGEPSPARRAAYRGSASGWQPATVPFSAVPGWRGNALNDDSDNDRGWAMGFTIPFSSLGLASAPAEGTTWRMAVIVHDRDSHAGPPVGDQSWPPQVSPDSPATWGGLRFGLPTYRSAATPTGLLTIRRPTEGSPLVPDADVGGAIANQCPGDEYHIWNEWGNRNYGSAPDFNIQNQSDVADWPCFAKYYVTFPLDGIPPGKVIVSATLTLHQFGNAGGSEAQPSWIQVLTASGDWQEGTITWNNAPLAEENIGGSWVAPITDFSGWPGVPRTWDVSYAVAQAYARGQPLRLVLYEADSAYHSGKYFVSSDTGNWNEAGRPRLEVTWGEAP